MWYAAIRSFIFERVMKALPKMVHRIAVGFKDESKTCVHTKPTALRLLSVLARLIPQSYVAIPTITTKEIKSSRNAVGCTLMQMSEPAVRPQRGIWTNVRAGTLNIKNYALLNFQIIIKLCKP